MTIVTFNPLSLRGVVHPHDQEASFVFVPHGPGLEIYSEFRPVPVVEGRAELLPTPEGVQYRLEALWGARSWWYPMLTIPDVAEVALLDLVEVSEWERKQMAAAAEGIYQLDAEGNPV